MRVRRLNKEGIERFAEWLESLKLDGSMVVPSAILVDDATSEDLPVALEVQPQLFSSRWEAAEHLAKAFGDSGIQDVELDHGLWSWLSLFYIDSVCPSVGGSRKPGALARYIPESQNFQRYYRHLLAGPYRIWRAYRGDPGAAMCLLCQAVNTPGDVVEQLASRQERVTNKGVISLATRLYVDPKKNAIRRGAGGKGAGSVRRLTDILDQFELTWDVAIADSGALLEMLPQEFRKYTT